MTVAITSLAIVIIVGFWSAQPHYVPLTDSISANQAAEVVAKLDSLGIANRLNYSGTIVMVDQASFGRAKVAIADVVEPGQMAPHHGSWGGLMDPASRQAQRMAQREVMLANRIAALLPIAEAQVTLAIPEESVFLNERREPSANVLVVTHSNQRLTRPLAESIAMLVASGVERMKRSNVTVIDQHGRTFTARSDELGVGISDQIETRQAEEQRLMDKAVDMLDRLVGPGNSIVKVSADMDFTHIRSQRTVYDPEGKVVRREDRTKTETRGTPRVAEGPAGTRSNLQQLAGERQAANTTSKSETDTREWDNSLERIESNQPGGNVTRLSVSAIVELPDALANDPSDGLPAGEPTDQREMRAEIEQLIKNAVGFDAARGDEFQLVISKLVGKPELIAQFDEPVPVLSPFWTDLIRNLSLGLGALAALFLGYLVLRRVQPMGINITRPADITPERARQIAQLSTLVKENPELLSRIIAAWADDSQERRDAGSTPGDSSTRSTSSARRAA